MRIQNEIENVERVKEKIATMPLTMEDAIEFHKKVAERVQKDRKDINKELGIGDVEKDGFTGRTKNFKTSTPELKKMKLSESLFEELEDTDGWGDEIEYILSETFSKIENLIYEINNCRRGSYTDCETAEELADYIHRLAEDLDECSYEIKANSKNINESLNEDWDDLINDIEKEERDKNQAEATQHMIDQQEKEKEEEAEKAEEEKVEKAKEEKRIQAAEEKRKKAEEERKARLKDKVWAEKDWVYEKAKAAKEGRELDLKDYSKEEQDAIKQGLEDFAGNETAQAQYLRKKEKEMKDAAKDAAEKAEKEKKDARKELFGYSGDIEDIPKAIGNVGKAIAGVPDKIKTGLSKAGINI